MRSWNECKNDGIIKEIKPDKNMINSLKEIAEIKIHASYELPDKYITAKISLLYDALREYLECIALSKGYKIYNHECYYSFINDILNKDIEAKKFDRLRKIRNSINYYGRQITIEEGKIILKEITSLIEEFKEMID